MKVLHVIPSLAPCHGGPSEAMLLVARTLSRSNVLIDIATTNDAGPGLRAAVATQQWESREGYRVICFQKQSEFYKVSLPFRFWALRHFSDYDIVHIHALFSFTSVCSARIARKYGIPYIIRPLGTLNRWGMVNRRRLLKAVSYRLIEHPILQNAAAIHFTSEQERNEAEMNGQFPKGVVVPLGVNLETFLNPPPPSDFFDRHPVARGRPVILFLSRIDPVKRLEILLRAFSIVQKQRPEALLVIVGDGDPPYIASLKALTRDLSLSGSILWAGALSGREKLAAFAAAMIFVLPSRSENFGIALVEAMAAGLPCITTSSVPISEDLISRNAGVVVDSEQSGSIAEHAPVTESFAKVLQTLIDNAPLRLQLGQNARQLALDKYSDEAMAKRLRHLYASVQESNR